MVSDEAVERWPLIGQNRFLHQIGGLGDGGGV